MSDESHTDNESADILERYWAALQDGGAEQALELRKEIEDRHESIKASLDLLDEIRDAQSLFVKDTKNSQAE